MIGFVVDYRRSDELWQLLSLAKLLEKTGHDVQIMPTGRTHRVHQQLDARLTRTRNYGEWVKRCSWVVFSDLPPVEYVAVAREAGARTALLARWAAVGAKDMNHLGELDAVLCSSKCVYQHFADRQGMPAVVHMPLDLGMPVIHNENGVDPDRIALLWYLDGSQPFMQDRSFMNIARLIIKDPRVYITVLYGNQLPPDYLNELLKLQLEADGRLELMRDLPWEKQFLVMAAHDLVLWPAVVENTGVVGMLSATSGTPCLAYDYPVVADVVKDEVNGILLPCELKFSELGVPVVVKRDDFFTDSVKRLLDSTGLLQHMRNTARYGLEMRRQHFEEAVENTFAYRVK